MTDTRCSGTEDAKLLRQARTFVKREADEQTNGLVAQTQVRHACGAANRAGHSQSFRKQKLRGEPSTSSEQRDTQGALTLVLVDDDRAALVFALHEERNELSDGRLLRGKSGWQAKIAP
jgi:hypothetical protein